MKLSRVRLGASAKCLYPVARRIDRPGTAKSWKRSMRFEPAYQAKMIKSKYTGVEKALHNHGSRITFVKSKDRSGLCGRSGRRFTRPFRAAAATDRVSAP